MNENLTPKQQQFINEYFVDFNSTKALMRTDKEIKIEGARLAGRKMLNIPHVAAEIAKRRMEKQEELQITSHRVLVELARIAFSDPKSLFDDDGKIRSIFDLEDDLVASISSIEIEERKNKKGKTIGHTKKVRFWNKLEGLIQLGKYLNLFPDHVKVEGTIRHSHAHLKLDLLPIELKRQLLEFIRSQKIENQPCLPPPQN